MPFSMNSLEKQMQSERHQEPCYWNDKTAIANVSNLYHLKEEEERRNKGAYW